MSEYQGGFGMLKNNAYTAYATNKILTATPAELTLMLYEGAIKFCNIAVKAIEDTDIEKVSKKANILEDIETMQDRFETRIGENGIKISGGQKQRIQIARNLLNIRKINIFDDTLSALDSDTEKKVI